MIRTNINITTTDKVFKYLADYIENSELYSSTNWKYITDIYDEYNVLQLTNNSYINLYRKLNTWEVLQSNRTKYLPEYIKTSTIKLRIPRYSVEVYSKVYYSLSVYFLNRDRKICLGNYLINQLDFIGDYLNNDYYESISVVIPDIKSILYDDDWKEFRSFFFDDYVSTKYTTDKKSIIIDNLDLIIELYPLQLSENKYIELTNYSGGYNSFNLDVSRELNLKVSLDRHILSLNMYLGDNQLDNFEEYIKNKYKSENVKISYEIVLKDTNNIYKYIKSTSENTGNYQVDLLKEFAIKDWNDYLDGLIILCCVNIYYGDNTITMFSNEIPVTKEVYKYLINNDIPTNINLNRVNMNNYRIDIVNKVEKKIIEVEGISGSKSNIIKPVFIRTHDANNIKLHPSVTENIGINLDLYKANVEVFYIKIEDVEFSETARTQNGVIFKVIGNKLANEVTSGTYYILNENHELVTTGNYVYI